MKYSLIVFDTYIPMSNEFNDELHSKSNIHVQQSDIPGIIFPFI